MDPQVGEVLKNTVEFASQGIDYARDVWNSEPQLRSTLLSFGGGVISQLLGERVWTSLVEDTINSKTKYNNKGERAEAKRLGGCIDNIMIRLGSFVTIGILSLPLEQRNFLDPDTVNLIRLGAGMTAARTFIAGALLGTVGSIKKNL